MSKKFIVSKAEYSSFDDSVTHTPIGVFDSEEEAKAWMKPFTDRLIELKSKGIRLSRKQTYLVIDSFDQVDKIEWMEIEHEAYFMDVPNYTTLDIALGD